MSSTRRSMNGVWIAMLAAALGCGVEAGTVRSDPHECGAECGQPGGSYATTSAACTNEPLVPPTWRPDTPYVYGQQVTNDGGKVYQMVSYDVPTGGKSGTAGGPTGPAARSATAP